MDCVYRNRKENKRNRDVVSSRILRIGWESHTTNEEALFQADTEGKLMKTIKKQQLPLLGHCMRKDGCTSP